MYTHVYIYNYYNYYYYLFIYFYFIVFFFILYYFTFYFTFTLLYIYFSYNYIEDNIKEKFTRSLSSDVTSTYNDFYGRKDTIKALGTFQYPDNHWDRSIGKTEVFDDSYIPTVHVTGDKVDSFFVKASSSTFDHITFYFKNTTRTFDVNVFFFFIIIIFTHIYIICKKLIV